MPTYTCPVCDTSHSLGGIPEEKMSHLISDEAIEELVDRILGSLVEDREQTEANVGFLIMTAGNEVYHCPDCGTLVITGDGKLAGVYRPLKS